MAPNRENLSLQVWTEHFLGTEAHCEAFLDLLTTMEGGRWWPEKWGHFEPIRSPFTPDARDPICRAWVEERGKGSGMVSNDMFLRKSDPRMLAHVRTWRGKVPTLNYVFIELASKPFASADGVERLVQLMLDLIRWSGAVYATAWHWRQAHKRRAPGTPLDRLDQLNWMTYFGRPYIEMFGHSRVLDARCHAIRQVFDGMLLMAAPRPDGPEITSSDELLLGLEDSLGSNAFAGHGYPEVPCRVPQFDLSETRV